MNVYVCAKQVPDTETKIELKDDKTIDESAIKKWIINPYDEYAVEEAVQLKEKLGDVEVIVVTLGPEKAQEAIRLTLAMGADRALHIVCDQTLDHHLTAKALANAIKADGEPSLVFMGKQAIAADAYQVHLRMAHILGAAAVTNVIAFEWNDGVIAVDREIDEGALEKVELKPPALVAVTKGINTPRYPPLPSIMKAKRKEIKKLTLADVGVEGCANFEEIVGLRLPDEKSGTKMLEGESQETVPELVNLLKNEAKVI
jgi:electron transfer flavoprotein beta subunit